MSEEYHKQAKVRLLTVDLVLDGKLKIDDSISVVLKLGSYSLAVAEKELGDEHKDGNSWTIDWEKGGVETFIKDSIANIKISKLFEKKVKLLVEIHGARGASGGEILATGEIQSRDWLANAKLSTKKWSEPKQVEVNLVAGEGKLSCTGAAILGLDCKPYSDDASVEHRLLPSLSEAWKVWEQKEVKIANAISGQVKSPRLELDGTLNSFAATFLTPLMKTAEARTIHIRKDRLSANKKAKALIKAMLANPNLKEIVWENADDTDVLHYLLKELAGAKHLEVLDLSRNDLGDDTAISDMLKGNGSLRELRLQKNEITEALVEPLCAVIEAHKSLERVDLRKNKIDTPGFTAVVRLLKGPAGARLKEVLMDGNVFEKEVALKEMELVKKAKILTLDKDIEAVASQLEEAKKTEHFYQNKSLERRRLVEEQAAQDQSRIAQLQERQADRERRRLEERKRLADELADLDLSSSE